MANIKLTEHTIRNLATDQSFQRGEEYYDDGAVSKLIQRDHTLTTQVEGSEYDPYDVTIHLHNGGVASADCSCPYDWGGYCKHIVAAMLAYVRNPSEVDYQESITNLLENLDRSQLLTLLKKRLEVEPRLADWIEAEISVLKATAKPDNKEKTKRRTLVDPEPFRRKAQRVLRGGSKRRGYWDDYDSIDDTDELEKLVESASPFLEAGDGQNALRVLEPIADIFVKDWMHYRYGHYDEDMYLLFSNLGNLFAEAILSTDLSQNERKVCMTTLQGWQDELDQYGVDDAFWIAIGAANQGWDDPNLQKVLKGESKEDGWEKDDRWDDEELTEVRLRVLERQERTDEYLNLAMATSGKSQYATMLVKLGDVDKAVTFGMKEFDLPKNALDLAKVLKDHNHLDESLKIGEAGLKLRKDDSEDYHESVTSLAHWLRDFSGGLGKGKLALESAKVAFMESLTLEDYKSVKDYAGKKWDHIRPELLTQLATAEHAHERTEIYLFEEMVGEAVQSIGDKDYFARDDTLMKVAEMAVTSHSDWVIEKCCEKAESIMDSGQAKYYKKVVSWLQPVHRAHYAQARDEEWSRYLEGLISKHERKYKLRPLLEGMRVKKD